MDAFNQYTPSVFVIETPFQAICVVQAIRDFKIEDYMVLVWNTVRLNQTASVLNYFDISFRIEDMELVTNKKCWLKAMFRNSHYRRAFIGFPKMHMLFCACRYIGFRSTIVLLDDGLATITLFKKGKLIDFDNWFVKPFKHLTRLKRITYNKHVYTIFDDIPHEGFSIHTNSMSLLQNNRITSPSFDIFMIGTDPVSYSKSIGIDIDDFFVMLNRILLLIRKQNPNHNLYYIPHGADRGEITKKICSNTGWIFKPVKMTAEMFFLRNSTIPVYIYGFLSTALIVIKKIFPLFNVLNIFPHAVLDNDKLTRYKELSLYYAYHDIISVDEDLVKVDL